MPAPLIRCNPPIHNSRSGLTGFFTNTGMSTPLRLSASSCMAKGLVVVRAPTQSRSMPALSAASTCLGVATSVVMSIPVSCFTLCIQGRAFSPFPSKPPGLVRGFHIPALKSFTPFDAKSLAVFITCSSVSALQGPAITRGRFTSIPGRFNGCMSSSIVYYFLFVRQRVLVFLRSPLSHNGL